MKKNDTFLISFFILLILLFLMVGNVRKKNQEADEQRRARWEKIEQQAEEDCWRIYNRPCSKPSVEQLEQNAKEAGERVTEMLHGEQ
ncbi:MAG: hypothetical protein HYT65_00325 [Candidatus Yanofskybacteria bacterium]|nr:hypothetical protein [Candidatus Yanofskybacteria bacterium]